MFTRALMLDPASLDARVELAVVGQALGWSSAELSAQLADYARLLEDQYPLPDALPAPHGG